MYNLKITYLIFINAVVNECRKLKEEIAKEILSFRRCKSTTFPKNQQ